MEKEKTVSYDQYPFEIGKSYFFRTVTYHVLGKVEKIVGDFAILSGASWIADSGRYHEVFVSGKLNEVEFLGENIINLKALADAKEWKFPLPTESR